MRVLQQTGPERVPPAVLRPGHLRELYALSRHPHELIV